MPRLISPLCVHDLSAELLGPYFNRRFLQFRIVIVACLFPKASNGGLRIMKWSINPTGHADWLHFHTKIQPVC